MIKFSPATAPLHLPAIAALVLILLTSGCINHRKMITPDPPPIPDGGQAVPEDNTAVLSDDTQVIAKTGFGRIKIEAGPGMRRVFTWNGMRRGLLLKPRDTETDESSNGLYFEGTPPVWESANGVTRVEIQEGYRNFENADDALIWMQIRRPYFTYNNSGLAIGWRRVKDTLEAEVWQFRIAGEIPSSMPGADDSSIALGPLNVQPQKMSPVWLYPDGHTEPASRTAIASANTEPADESDKSVQKKPAGDPAADKVSSVVAANRATKTDSASSDSPDAQTHTDTDSTTESASNDKADKQTD